MRTLHREGRGVAGKDRGASVEIELPIDIGKAFQQPAPKKASASGNEDVFMLHLIPERLRLVEDMVKIGNGQRLLDHGLCVVILADAWIAWPDGVTSASSCCDSFLQAGGRIYRYSETITRALFCFRL